MSCIKAICLFYICLLRPKEHKLWCASGIKGPLLWCLRDQRPVIMVPQGAKARYYGASGIKGPLLQCLRDQRPVITVPQRSKARYYGASCIKGPLLWCLRPDQRSVIMVPHTRSEVRYYGASGIKGPLLWCLRDHCSGIKGPLIFLLIVNDLTNVSSVLYPLMFVDDTNCFSQR